MIFVYKLQRADVFAFMLDFLEIQIVHLYYLAFVNNEAVYIACRMLFYWKSICGGSDFEEKKMCKKKGEKKREKIYRQDNFCFSYVWSVNGWYRPSTLTNFL